MREEQLGRLEEWASGLLNSPNAYGDGAAVCRLLEERRRLLEALTRTLERVPLTDYELAARVRLARAAIAFAEEESP